MSEVGMEEPKKEEEEMEKEKEDEEDEEEMKKTGLEENPEEGAESGTDASSSTSPNMGVPSTQNVAHGPATPSSAARMANNSAQSPSEVSYTGKSYGNVDLNKSPLYVELSKQIGEMNKALMGKVNAIEKSMNDRLVNLQKTMSAVEKFYDRPLYKSVDENVNPEAVQAQSISKQIESGKVRFSS